MSACQCASVASTSLSPEGNITTTTDVLKVVGGVVNTCPAVLWSWPVLKSVFCFFCSMFFSLQFQFGMLESPENQDLILKT